MAVQNVILSLTKEAYNDLSSKQYYAMKLITGTTSNLVDCCSAQGERCFGILQNEPTQGLAANVAVLGTSKAIVSHTAGYPIHEGDLLTTGSAGKLELARTGDYVMAHALEDSAATNDILEVLLIPSGGVVLA